MMMLIRRKTRHAEHIRGFVFSVLGTVTSLKGQNLANIREEKTILGSL